MGRGQIRGESCRDAKAEGQSLRQSFHYESYLRHKLYTVSSLGPWYSLPVSWIECQRSGAFIMEVGGAGKDPLSRRRTCSSKVLV